MLDQAGHMRDSDMKRQAKHDNSILGDVMASFGFGRMEDVGSKARDVGATQCD